MQCPSCNHPHTKVLESRSTDLGKSIRRRRQCLNCSFRFTTYERVEFIPLTVIKKDGRKESFDRSKLLRGMIRACEKTNISLQILESIVNDLELQLQQNPTQEITSREMGKLVLNQLKKVSEVAYVRFASVYNEFTSIEDFMKTLHNMQKELENLENSENDHPED
jgi:transcriptional repressor NrdR